MQRKIRIAAAVAAFAMAGASGGVWLPAHAADERYQRSTEELAKVRKSIDEVSASIEHDRGEESSAQAAVEAAEHKLAAAAAEVRRIAGEIAAQENRVRQTQAERASAEQRLARQKQVLAQQLRAAYILGAGQGGRTEMMLSVDDPQKIDRMMVYYDALDRARSRDIAAIVANLAKVNDLAAQYQSQLDALHQLEYSRKQALATLESTRTERAQAVAAISTRIADESGQLKSLQASEKQLRDLIEQLRRALAETPVIPQQGSHPFGELHGRLVWPLRGNILARYGEPKAGGRLQWKGLWIGASDGAEVRACARGRVAYVGWLSSYGLIVVLQHDQGYFTLYGHTSAVSRSVGESVNAGEVIAQAGNTGGYEQPGVYFELRKGAETLDPTGWFAH